MEKKSSDARKKEERFAVEIRKSIIQDYYLAKRIKGFIKKSQSFIKISLITNPKLE